MGMNQGEEENMIEASNKKYRRSVDQRSLL